MHVAELQLVPAPLCCETELQTLEPEQAPLAPAAQHSAASFAALAERAERADRGAVTVRHGQRNGRRVLAAA